MFKIPKKRLFLNIFFIRNMDSNYSIFSKKNYIHKVMNIKFFDTIFIMNIYHKIKIESVNRDPFTENMNYLDGVDIFNLRKKSL